MSDETAKASLCGCRQVDVNQERCTCCGQPSPVGFTVPDAVWLRVAGQMDGIVYCIMCFAARADALDIDWSAAIHFWPVSARAAREVSHDWPCLP